MVIESDDGIEIYINGFRVGSWGSVSSCVNRPGCTNNVTASPIDVTEYLEPGSNVIAAKLLQAGGGMYFKVDLRNE